MKYFVAIALIATVASAAIIKPTAVSGELAEIQDIIAAINSPSTNPATAAALQDMLFEMLGVKPEPIAVGPAIIEAEQEPISVGPAIVDFPVLETPDIVPSPVVVAPGPVADVTAASAPMVQIILNINQASIAPAPVVVPEADKPEPIHVVESAPEIIETAPIAVNPIGVVEIAPEPVHVVEVAAEPVHVVEVAPEPVHVVEVAPVEAVPIQVIETAPIAVEPVIIGTPIIPAPVVVLPETLN